ncbi:hypothetical protein Tco_0360796 [Tanacetum coccineum]
MDQENCNSTIGQENEVAKIISNEHLYSASANEIDEKNPELKDLPSHLEYAYLHNDEKDAKPRLIQWVVLLQGFNIEIKDKKGAENLAIDHLSRLENPHMEMLNDKEIADEVPDEHLMMLKIKFNDDEPCFFKDAKEYAMKCDACQRSGNISSRSEMP